MVAGDIYITFKRICENAANPQRLRKKKRGWGVNSWNLTFLRCKDKSSKKDEKQMRKLEGRCHPFFLNTTICKSRAITILFFAIVKMIPHEGDWLLSHLKFFFLGSPRMVGCSSSLRGSKWGITSGGKCQRWTFRTTQFWWRQSYGKPPPLRRCCSRKWQSHKLPKIFWQGITHFYPCSSYAIPFI